MDIYKSLAQIATDYSIFEKDQVLTHDQLNSIAGYLDDQTRLGRIGLLGVGIICGLRVSLTGGVIQVTRGPGSPQTEISFISQRTSCSTRSRNTMRRIPGTGRFTLTTG